MRYIFILLFLSLGLSAVAQQNIVESLQRNRAGEGTVTIYQDPKITGLIGSIYTGNVTGGCWKSYGDPDAAQKHFDQLSKCTAVYLRLFHSGTPILRLAVAA